MYISKQENNDLEGFAQFFGYLADRWLDESEFEDPEEYKQTVKERVEAQGYIFAGFEIKPSGKMVMAYDTTAAAKKRLRFKLWTHGDEIRMAIQKLQYVTQKIF